MFGGWLSPDTFALMTNPRTLWTESGSVVDTAGLVAAHMLPLVRVPRGVSTEDKWDLTSDHQNK